jgi:sec-independent protein translocase protein TatA
MLWQYNYTIMGDWCYRNTCYISDCFITFFGGKKFRNNEGLGSGIKKFKNAAKDGQPADKKKRKKKKEIFFKNIF